ncbi:GNAT family N-acetyltransferase [Salinithrix halophila]|uniref:GNAT family N-acetyltransferase n=1 Tax=Salinithrix halophila TaxID=1485204 RepID=A0ABV8JIF0_9BACL
MERIVEGKANKRFMEGNRIILRPLEGKHAEFFYESMQRQETRRLTGTQRVHSLEGVRSFIESVQKDASRVDLVIFHKEEERPLGELALMEMDPFNRHALLRIAIDRPEDRGKGYGSEALEVLLEYAFGVLQLHRIELEVFAFNASAIRAYEKVGFKKEGIRREVLFYDHRYHDAHVMGILESDYRALRRAEIPVDV